MDSERSYEGDVDARFAEFFDALAHPVRLRILGLLSRADDPLNATTIASRLDISDTLASHHLQQLKSCEAVAVEERGRENLHEIGTPKVDCILSMAHAHLEDLEPPLLPEDFPVDG